MDSFNTCALQGGRVNQTQTFGPTLVNEARFGVNRIIFDNGGDDQRSGQRGRGAGHRGSPTTAVLDCRESNFQRSGLNIGNQNIGTQALFANTTFHLADNMTHIRGRHTMKFGGQWLRQRMNTLYTGNTGRTGFITFDGRLRRVRRYSDLDRLCRKPTSSWARSRAPAAA